MKDTRGFTLIELLLVVAILSLLTAIVLSSLATARSKAADTRIKTELRTVVLQSSQHYTTAGRGFGTAAWSINNASFTPGAGVDGSGPFFQNRTVGEALNSIARTGGSVSYGSNDSSWIVVTSLKTGGYFCVDSGGTSAGMWIYSGPSVVYNYGLPAYRCQ